MKRFSLRLTEAEYLKLKVYSEKIQVSMNYVLRELIREWSPKENVVEETTLKD